MYAGSSVSRGGGAAETLPGGVKGSPRGAVAAYDAGWVSCESTKIDVSGL
jgi:alanine dehydrogenase